MLRKSAIKLATFVTIGIIVLSGFAAGDWLIVEAQEDLTYPIVDTGQDTCFSDTSAMNCPTEGSSFYGQDAQYSSNAPAYQDNGDGTISDLNTGLMWSKSPVGKMTWQEAVNGASSFNLGGYTDWRLPTIKELYSLIDFRGLTGMDISSSVPYIDTRYFEFYYGDVNTGERMIDAQYWSSTEYVSTSMGGAHTVFGVNFADGRIKGYGDRSGQMQQYVRYVRGNTNYGINDFVDNGDGTISDNATGLMWMQNDSGVGLNWGEALAYCENLDHAGYSDWRLPDAKELQSIVDYTRSPDTTNSAAIDPIFNITADTNPLGQTDYPNFWTSTTHADGMNIGSRGAYIAFGRAMGYMNNQWVDVHGAGAQRSDVKSGDPSSLPVGLGPQGDEQGIYNHARCVRGGDVSFQSTIANSMFNYSVSPPAGGPSDQQQNTNQGQQEPDGQQQGPPQAAIDACNGLAQGSTCQFDTPNGTVSGTCNAAPNGQTACKPAGGGPPGQ